MKAGWRGVGRKAGCASGSARPQRLDLCVGPKQRICATMTALRPPAAAGHGLPARGPAPGQPAAHRRRPHLPSGLRADDGGAQRALGTSACVRMRCAASNPAAGPCSAPRATRCSHLHLLPSFPAGDGGAALGAGGLHRAHHDRELGRGGARPAGPGLHSAGGAQARGCLCVRVCVGVCVCVYVCASLQGAHAPARSCLPACPPLSSHAAAPWLPRPQVDPSEVGLVGPLGSIMGQLVGGASKVNVDKVGRAWGCRARGCCAACMRLHCVCPRQPSTSPPDLCQVLFCLTWPLAPIVCARRSWTNWSSSPPTTRLRCRPSLVRARGACAAPLHLLLCTLTACASCRTKGAQKAPTLILRSQAAPQQRVPPAHPRPTALHAMPCHAMPCRACVRSAHPARLLRHRGHRAGRGPRLRHRARVLPVHQPVSC